MLAGWTIACSSSPSVSTKICRFLPLMSLPPSNPGGSIQAPFFGAFHALAVNDASAGTGFPFGFFPAFDVQRIIDAPQRAVVVRTPLSFESASSSGVVTLGKHL